MSEEGESEGYRDGNMTTAAGADSCSRHGEEMFAQTMTYARAESDTEGGNVDVDVDVDVEGDEEGEGKGEGEGEGRTSSRRGQISTGIAIGSSAPKEHNENELKFNYGTLEDVGFTFYNRPVKESDGTATAESKRVSPLFRGSISPSEFPLQPSIFSATRNDSHPLPLSKSENSAFSISSSSLAHVQRLSNRNLKKMLEGRSSSSMIIPMRNTRKKGNPTIHTFFFCYLFLFCSY